MQLRAFLEKGCPRGRLKALSGALIIALLSLAERTEASHMGPIIFEGEASDVVWYFRGTRADTSQYKEYYFGSMSRGLARRVSRSAYTLADRSTYMMLYTTRSSVPDNLTDADLASFGSDIPRLKRKASVIVQAASGGQLRNLEAYPPADVANIARSLVLPWYENLEKPWGASGTTWASESLRQAYIDMRLAALAKRSVLIRLLGDERTLIVPTNTVLYFAWSGRPSIPIDLQLRPWHKSDVRKLRGLLDSPYYAQLAQRRIDLILAENQR